MEIIRSDFAMETEMESGVTSGAQSARGYAAVSTNPLNSLRNIGTELRYAGPDRLPIKQEGAFFFPVRSWLRRASLPQRPRRNGDIHVCSMPDHAVISSSPSGPHNTSIQ